MVKKTSILALAGAALLGAASISQAQSIFLDFEGPGDYSNDFAPVGLTIGYGEVVLSTDEFGDEIPGSEHWELLTGDFVPVNDPSAADYGAAPSGLKALDARSGAVLFVFEDPWDISGLSFTLDNSTYGLAFSAQIEFFDANHNLLFTQSYDQTVPGLQVNVSDASLVGVKTIVLAGNAYYDDIAIQAVPEPSTWALMLGGAAFMLYRLRRRTAR